MILVKMNGFILLLLLLLVDLKCDVELWERIIEATESRAEDSSPGLLLVQDTSEPSNIS
jgi:hypothetical protein